MLCLPFLQLFLLACDLSMGGLWSLVTYSLLGTDSSKLRLHPIWQLLGLHVSSFSPGQQGQYGAKGRTL